MLKNDKGIITTAFLLVLLIIFFLIFSFFGLAMTFVHVSVSQYMSYSMARKLALGGESEPKQREEAVGHYDHLRGKIFQPNAHSGGPGNWFGITENLSGRQSEYTAFVIPDFEPSGHAYLNNFYGAGLNFETRIAIFKIPFLVDEKDKEYEAKITSFLGREPSTEECEDFFGSNKRGDEIADKYNNPSLMPDFDKSIITMNGDDNGC